MFEIASNLIGLHMENIEFHIPWSNPIYIIISTVILSSYEQLSQSSLMFLRFMEGLWRHSLEVSIMVLNENIMISVYYVDY